MGYRDFGSFAKKFSDFVVVVVAVVEARVVWGNCVCQRPLNVPSCFRNCTIVVYWKEAVLWSPWQGKAAVLYC